MIEIKGKAPLMYNKDHIISKLYCYIKQDVVFFIALREILLLYGEVQYFNSREYRKDIEILKLNYPILSDIHTDDFFKTIESLFLEYYLEDQEGYKIFRGEFTEYVIANSGPYYCSLDEICVSREAVFFEEGQLLQPCYEEEFNHNFDICFSDKVEFTSIKDVECEVFECKTKIENFLRARLLENSPTKKKDQQDRNKIRFMEALGIYFSTSKMFKIAFATLTMNISYSQQWLERFPALQLKIISGKMIENRLKEKVD